MASYDVPDLCKQFVHYLYRHIRERNIPEIQSMYEVSFLKLSERYYKASPWPAVELIADVVDQDHVFCLLYKELYFRHLYARCSPNLRQRCESWDNYCDLFGLLLHSNVNMQLPNIWLWDMIDEFIYQFQSFCQYRGKVSQKTPEELELLKQCDKVWNVLEVLNVLQALVDKSGIIADLEGDGGAKFYATEGFYPNESNVLRMLGYFSLVSLLRVHTLVGDYYSALKAVYPINLNEPHINLYTPKIMGANISLFYYAGFCYMMMRRYIDAARCFNTILAYINRTKQYHVRSVQYDQILKKNEQMYALLACVVALCPAAHKLLDENVATQLRDRNADKILRMGRGELSVYDELFSYSCPKFITASQPTYDNLSVNTNQQEYRVQLDLFLSEVRSQTTLPLLKQYLLLYSSIDIQKLASLMELDQATLRQQLTCLKAKSYSLQWTGGADATQGQYLSASDIDFYIDTDASGREMVNVSDTVHQKQHTDFLARHISKFEEIIKDLDTPSVAALGAKPAAVY
mmetsp:Transcript_19202/g.53747  ORF Transcript_19202/g.53747 Transcript_19202/m.53747 type:complete len:518 (-) Transcript_19202:405-1958(-)|eukprot:CAMPEP_0202352316 /NCGR_PEP_ID=MMETSP1126-20121109/8564_1 /ASSEMBLY_ACC=CAM_ASM_000457 /TAXON_ID=3047 /ORGANISM="Dunaliella tertiolecta, Strain CCMP1320" /LENGTH=517 /DNA_ID=CAMNT_0048944517 /DNA_START=94 /DNA_END=1647 /DNA_ORIENTATION=-